MPLKLPELLKRLRRDHALSQEYIADSLKVNVSTYSRYERGDTDLKFSHAVDAVLLDGSNNGILIKFKE